MEHEQVEQRDSNPVVLRKDPKEEFKVVSLQLDFFSQFKKKRCSKWICDSDQPDVQGGVFSPAVIYYSIQTVV